MREIVISIKGTEYRCSSFYDDCTGVDVYLEETYWSHPRSSYLGDIEDIEIPDTEDKDAMDYFTEQIEDWLSGK